MLDGPRPGRWAKPANEPRSGASGIARRHLARNGARRVCGSDALAAPTSSSCPARAGSAEPHPAGGRRTCRGRRLGRPRLESERP